MVVSIGSFQMEKLVCDGPEVAFSFNRNACKLPLVAWPPEQLIFVNQGTLAPTLPQREAIIGPGRLFPSKNPPFTKEQSEMLFTCWHPWRSTSPSPTVCSTAWVYYVMVVWRLLETYHFSQIKFSLHLPAGGVVCWHVGIGSLTDLDELQIKK